MAARKHYPVPTCPKCGKAQSRVRNTYYLEDGRILRYRECAICEWTQWTTQPAEQAVNPATHRVVIPKFAVTSIDGRKINNTRGTLRGCQVVEVDPI